MNTIVTTSIFLLSCFTGIILMGTLLAIYINIYTGKKIYRGIVLIGILSIITTVNELIILILSTKGMRVEGMEFHRIEALAISFYLFALPYLFHNLLELNYFLRKINRYIYISGIIAAAFLIVSYFITPELFLSISTPYGDGLNLWSAGRATPGVLFKVRNILLMFVSLYSLALLFYEFRVSSNRRFVTAMITGISIGILSGIADLVMDIIEEHSMPHEFRVISFVTFGLTAFSIIAMLAVIRNFIDQNQAIEKLKKNEFMEIIAGGIAHDFNNLLTGILGNTSLAIYNAEEKGDNQELLKSIEKAARRARGLSRQLLDFSRGGALIRGSVSLEKLISENINFIMAGSGIETVFRFESGILNVNADESQISQVIQNIAINAKQAMGGSGRLAVSCINISVTGPFSILKPGKYVKIEIRDTGPGIREKDLKNIFDPYYTTKKTGTGLGLATTFAIVKNHGGHIKVNSIYGGGAVFTIYLPATEKIEADNSLAARPHIKHSGRVLIMDDDDMVLATGMKMLNELGFNASCVTCGEDAIEEYKKSMEEREPYRLVIMDLTIAGGMGGAEAARLLKETDPSAVIILSTGYSHDLAEGNLSETGFSGMLPKPYTFDEMKKCIEKLI